MTQAPLTAAQVAAQLTDRIDALCSHLLKEGRRDGPEWRAGSVYGEKGNSLAVRLKGAKAGVWCDFATEESGDALGLVKACLRLSTAEAVTWSIEWLGLDGQKAARSQLRRAPWIERSAEADKERNVRVEIARRIWCEARRDHTGTVGDVYLQRRKIKHLAWPPTLRFHPALNFGPKRHGLVFPASSAPCRDRRANSAAYGAFISATTGPARHRSTIRVGGSATS
jgi:hypothetical protein